MAYLIGQLTWWLLLVGLLAGAAGWAWHVMKSAPRLEALERERNRLRGELIGLGASELSPGGRSAADDREVEVMRTRETILTARIRELEAALGEARDQRERSAGRVAEMERLLDQSQAAPLAAQVVDDRGDELEAENERLRGELTRAAPPDALAWRLRYFEARTRYLENQERTAGPAGDSTALVAMQNERDAARAELQALRTAPSPLAAASNEDAAAFRWRNRYLEARVRFLEGQHPQDTSETNEAERRAAWRSSYLDQRVAHLRGVGADPKELDAARARIAELEAGHEVSDDPTRLRWKARYLDARVQHLETRLADAPQPVAQAPTREAALPMETPPLVPAGAEVRPTQLPAPRNGAPDDLRLIDGVGPKTETSLNALGIHHFDQIAEWSRANIAWVDQYLRLRGRIIRERWVEQAQELARGASTSHRRRQLENA
ncbi:MAG: hypothetical protein AB7T08_04495 [Hyphomonadaceae bacterium]